MVWRTFIGAQLSTENSIFEPSIELFDSEDRNFPFAAGIVSYQITFVSILVNRDSASSSPMEQRQKKDVDHEG